MMKRILIIVYRNLYGFGDIRHKFMLHINENVEVLVFTLLQRILSLIVCAEYIITTCGTFIYSKID